jgi:hypothetical protein
MSEREMRRAAVLAQVKSRKWILVEAAERMELSYRQTKRLWKRYRKQGAAGLVHRSVGRSSNRAKPKKVRAKVVRLIGEKYSGEVGQRFGPTLAAEHLCSEDGIEISASTVRRWMLAEGLWSRTRHRNDTVPDGRTGNHLGGGRSPERLDRQVRSAAVTVHGLEERVCARAHGE